MLISGADAPHRIQGPNSARFGWGQRPLPFGATSSPSSHLTVPTVPPSLLAVVVFAADISQAKTTTASKVDKGDGWDGGVPPCRDAIAASWYAQVEGEPLAAKL